MKNSLLAAPSAPPNDLGGPDVAASLHAELNRGFPELSFEPVLEHAYREDLFRHGLKNLRINLAILIALVYTIVQVDRAVIPEFTAAVPVGARLGVMLPILVIGLGLTFLPRASLWYHRVMGVLMTLALMAIGWIGIVAWSLDEDRVFARLIIATIAVYFVMGFRFGPALAANLISMGFYITAALLWHMPAMELLQFLAMLMMTNVICAAGGYNLEHARRTAWLDGRLLAEIALLDGMTGIPNRRRLDVHLLQAWQQCLREKRPISLLFVDIDAFKAYNDHYGHQAGDEALKAVASAITRFGRRPLDMAARFGGEEFALVMCGTGPEPALKTAEDIIEAVRGLGIAHAKSTVAPVLTVSVGVACVVPAESRSCERLLRLADQALYVAKNRGRNRAHMLEAELELAVEFELDSRSGN
ncbi:MAG TPA: diguanylate cyclase [Vicinamibacterales bacterium]|nr:diguanylate cyclase [Vicinamibacterales bacterium]